MKHASTCSSWHRFSAVTIRWPQFGSPEGRTRVATERLCGFWIVCCFVEVKIIRTKWEIPIKYFPSDLWWIVTMGSESSCMTIAHPPPIFDLRKILWSLFALVGSWLVPKSLASFWWCYTLEMLRKSCLQIEKYDNKITIINDDNKLITRTILIYCDPNTNSKISELFDIHFFHVLPSSSIEFNLTIRMISTYFHVFQDPRIFLSLEFRCNGDAWNPWVLKFSCCKASLGSDDWWLMDD